MSLRKFRKPSLLDKHEAQERADKEVSRVEKVADKVKRIIKKVAKKK